MKFIHTYELKKIINKLSLFYIFLGQDLILINKNIQIILNFAKKKDFIEKNIIDIEKHEDWEKIIYFYKLNNLFFKKRILIVNFILKNLNTVLIKNINKLFYFQNLNILVILKFNQLSMSFKKFILIKEKISKINIIWCFTPNGLNFKKWINYEIESRKIKITKNALLLLYKYYEGNTIFAYHILNMISLVWKNKITTSKKIKNIINNFSNLNASDWINAIFQNKKKEACYILDTLYQQKYNPLILIRSLQKDLLILLHIKREKKININMFLKKNNIFLNRFHFFFIAIKSINFSNFLKVIRILLQIDIKIKSEYNNNPWLELKTLTLLLCTSIKK
ncbi:DNA polymerase III subunit delta [Buchnera aphidicola (Protaphis terricola)]|uniref:DNA polymerase III subunit delta n=1 Tax=Buchnera aphidicola TaxID=9 RepID=UPI0034641E06